MRAPHGVLGPAEPSEASEPTDVTGVDDPDGHGDATVGAGLFGGAASERGDGAASRPDHDLAAARVWDVAAGVCDPEIPALTIADLGILRSAAVVDGTATVQITPTYSGCPAMGAIRDDVTAALEAAGHERVRVTLVLTPAWTTDWMTDEGKAKLTAYGIAPPTGRAAAPRRPGRGPTPVALSVKCPRCESPRTRQMTRFASTACKALYVCDDCLEPFDHFKVL